MFARCTQLVIRFELLAFAQLVALHRSASSACLCFGNPATTLFLVCTCMHLLALFSLVQRVFLSSALSYCLLNAAILRGCLPAVYCHYRWLRHAMLASVCSSCKFCLHTAHSLHLALGCLILRCSAVHGLLCCTSFGPSACRPCRVMMNDDVVYCQGFWSVKHGG